VRQRHYPLQPGDNIIGRSRSCDITLAHPSISRRHLLLRVTDKGLVAQDLGSKNGSWVNGLRLSPGLEIPVDGSDRLFMASLAGRVDPAGPEGRVENVVKGPSSEDTTGLSRFPAGAARRITAKLVDMGVFCAISALLMLPVLPHFPPADPTKPLELLRSVIGAGWLSIAVGAGWTLLWVLYFVFFWGLVGATPGQWLMGLRLIDHFDRHPIGPLRAGLRLAAYSVSSVFLLLGHLPVIFRRDRRALHDVLSGTHMVRRYRRRSRRSPSAGRDKSAAAPEKPKGEKDEEPS